MSLASSILSRLKRITFWKSPQPSTNDSAIASSSSAPSNSPDASSQEESSLRRNSSMSPTTRVKRWQVNLRDGAVTPIKSNDRKRRASSIRSTSPIASEEQPQKRRRASDQQHDVTSGEEADDERPSTDASNPSWSSPLSSEPHIKHEPEDEADPNAMDIDANDNTVVSQSYIPPTADTVEEIRRIRNAKADRYAEEGWPATDVFVYRKLELRSLDPQVPEYFVWDMRFLPEALFTDDNDKAFIKPCKEDGNGKAAIRLYELFDTGNKVRDRILSKVGRAELGAKKSIEAYIRWSLIDAGFRQGTFFVPVLTVVDGSRSMKSGQILARTANKMRRLRQRWEEALQSDEQDQNTSRSSSSPAAKGTIPHIYAIMVSHTAMQFFSYIPTEAMEKADDTNHSLYLREIASLSWRKRGVDVWNTFAVAIFVIHCRNVLMEAMGQERLKSIRMSVEVEDPDL